MGTTMDREKMGTFITKALVVQGLPELVFLEEQEVVDKHQTPVPQVDNMGIRVEQNMVGLVDVILEMVRHTVDVELEIHTEALVNLSTWEVSVLLVELEAGVGTDLICDMGNMVQVEHLRSFKLILL
ncbi:hypothetical protein CYMTET_44147 [Cymbomonas tetramitiformis]|uniref:Uncharacterized protein n=1 Tax=Cymbomonas tetramitiformis TaxID=36881 RepID=A0AAE0C0T7_9CHLO|nr:hypothetical protein CYMTET_44147 [Cymbomonas tetramitiformis]